jgi:hypothetical protein
MQSGPVLATSCLHMLAGSPHNNNQSQNLRSLLNQLNDSTPPQTKLISSELAVRILPDF